MEMVQAKKATVMSLDAFDEGVLYVGPGLLFDSVWGDTI